MDDATRLLLEPAERENLWQQLAHTIESYIANVDQAPVAPPLNVEQVRSWAEQFDFGTPLDPIAAVELVADGLWHHQVHTPHARYFGLFNPAPTTMGIAADALVATFNPQVAAWSHNPLAAEVERHLVREFGLRFGYKAAEIDGTFTTGGAEANHTALLCALVHTFPDFARRGLRALAGQPVFYVSTQSHHSLVKAARFCGLGTDSVRQIATDAEFRMDVDQLRAQIKKDRTDGYVPFMVVATLGTTNAGIIEPIQAIADIAAEENLWFHVDAAWGGLAMMVPELRGLIAGSERADSITFDAHKSLSVPMSAGIVLTRHPDILAETCRISTDYMPRDGAGLDVVDPFVHSMQWSRRFIGLKVFLSLAVAGWDGYAAVLRHQVKMGDLLRETLAADQWTIVNKTPLPVICFTDMTNNNADTQAAIVNDIVTSGGAWISTTRLDAQTPVLRACITNYRTSPDDVQALVTLLHDARIKLAVAMR